MWSGARSLFMLLVVCATLELGTSLKCYSCASVSGLSKNCEEDVCKGDQVSCLKIAQSVQNEQLEVRSCGHPDACRLLNGCYSCTSNLCNSSINVRPSFVVTGVVCLLSAIMWLSN